MATRDVRGRAPPRRDRFANLVRDTRQQTGKTLHAASGPRGPYQGATLTRPVSRRYMAPRLRRGRHGFRPWRTALRPPCVQHYRPCSLSSIRAFAYLVNLNDGVTLTNAWASRGRCCGDLLRWAKRLPAACIACCECHDFCSERPPLHCIDVVSASVHFCWWYISLWEAPSSTRIGAARVWRRVSQAISGRSATQYVRGQCHWNTRAVDGRSFALKARRGSVPCRLGRARAMFDSPSQAAIWRPQPSNTHRAKESIHHA